MCRWLRSVTVLALLAAGVLAASDAPAQEAPTAEQLGTLCFADGTHKRIEPDDALWAARMIHGETGGSPTAEESAAMLWSMAQRSHWSPTWRPKSLGELVRAYSQPINPSWTRSGRHCKKYYAEDYAGEIPDNCSASRLRRREQYRALPWSGIDATARDAVLRFAGAELENPVPGAIGWFATGLWNRRQQSGANAKEHMVLHSEIEQNTYFAADGPGSALDTRGWTGSEVAVAAAGSACPAQ